MTIAMSHDLERIVDNIKNCGVAYIALVDISAAIPAGSVLSPISILRQLNPDGSCISYRLQILNTDGYAYLKESDILCLVEHK